MGKPRCRDDAVVSRRSDNDLNDFVLASITQTLTQISGVSSADLSPIVAFELDIVGFDNGQSTTLSSGAGTITYTAVNAMTVVNAERSYCEFDGGTLETANTSYGELPTGSVRVTCRPSRKPPL
jgi:putative hemolysin